jgi:putative SOS response-associated peptidase YedK
VPLAFAIVTVPAGPDVVEVHDRMPAVIEPAQIVTWLASVSDEAGLAIQERKELTGRSDLAWSDRRNAIAWLKTSFAVDTRAESSAPNA